MKVVNNKLYVLNNIENIEDTMIKAHKDISII